MRDLLQHSKWIQNTSRDRLLLLGVGVVVVGLLLIGVVYVTSQGSVDTVLPGEEWTAEDKVRALDELHTTARQQGVPQLSDQDKLRILESIQNEPAQ